MALSNETGREDPVKEVYWLMRLLDIKPDFSNGRYQFRLAMKYFQGKGVERERERLEYHVNKSCEFGYETACRFHKNFKSMQPRLK